MNEPLTLFCVPHAGSNAMAYKQLQRNLGPQIELVPLELAGHGARMKETPPVDVATHVADLLPRVLDRIDGPFGFFCHSMGTLIGWELLLELQARGLHPVRVFFSGRYTPDVVTTTNWYQKSDRVFLEMIRAQGGTPEGLFRIPELVATFLPILRADYQLAETYCCPRLEALLDCDITALAGSRDGIVSPSELARWEEFGSRNFRMEIVPGSHFYLFEDPDSWARIVLRDLNVSRSSLVAGGEARSL
jgi:surfactin synthase thioesterase subunit